MNEFGAIYLAVLKYLRYRPRSEKEIRQYLVKKKVVIQVADCIIQKLKQQNFLNDEEFAKMWIRSRTEFKLKGERLIRLELQQKGIQRDTIDKAFAAYNTTQEENNGEIRQDLVLAKSILEKKRKKFLPMDRNERFRKAGSFLARKGFRLEDIKKAIEEIFGK